MDALPENLREFDDTKATRGLIYGNVLESLKRRFPIEDGTHRLELVDVRYDGPQEFSLKQQKQALLRNRNLRTPIRGTWRLTDKRTGQVLEEREDVVMQVPYWTDRGTIINNGSEYTVISQSRLRPGVYARRKSNGELETQFNIRPGTGHGFHLGINQETGVMTLRTGQGQIPLYQVLRGLGVDDKEIVRYWGSDVAAANSQKQDAQAWNKLYSRMAGSKANAAATEEEKQQFIRERLAKYEVDPEVVERTMGLRNCSHVTPELLLRASQKMLGLSRGDERPDNRDNPRFSKFYGVEDYFKERIDNNAGRLANNLLFKAKRRGLSAVQRNALNPWVDTVLQGSGLAMPGEEANPLSTLEQMSRISKFGMGGIASPEAVTMEARDVQGDYLGFVDPIAGPESEKIGVDVRASYRTFKGRDNKLYGEFIDNKTGKKAYVDIATASDRLVAFPGQDMSQPYVVAMKDGIPQKVPTKDVRYTVPTFAHMMGSNTNMNPMPTAVQTNRQFYGSKFWSQYLPQKNGEVPLVDSLMDDGKTTWSEYYGRKVGTLKSQVGGTVIKVNDDEVTVKGDDGRLYKTEMVKALPFNRLSAISYFPSVQQGQRVKAGDMLAHSNFTDARTGAINMGQNLHVGIVPYLGRSFEDAHVISESAAKRLATDRLYSFDHEARNGVVIDKKKYMASFPSKFTKEQFETLDDNGVVKVGTVLRRGDPMVVSLGPKLLTSSDKALGKLSKALRNSYTDRTETWEHDYEGTVVDAVMTPQGAKVNVSASPPVRPGDKLCYDPETEVLTSHGWKFIADVTLDDNVATLDPDTGMFDYIKPEMLHAYEHHGKMYRLKTQQLDLLVTPNHNMLVQPRGKPGFEFRKAEDIFGKRVSYKKDGSWEGFEPKFFTFPAMMVGHRWGSVLRDEIRMPIETFLMLLGMYLSEGNCVDDRKSSTYGIDISQRKPSFVKKAKEAFAAAGLDMPYGKVSGKFRLHGAQYLEYFRQFGRAFDKFVPDWVFGLSTRLQRILLKWLMWGDGHSEGGRYVNYTTTSRRLADDVQRLCLHCGYAANIVWSSKKAGTIGGMVDGHEIVSRHDAHDVRIVVSKLTPTVNHGHVRSQSAQTEEYVDYDGMVYCCTMPKWHAIYVRRNGKPCWCGNSGRFGLKGVVAKVVDDDKMPRDAVTNQPYDMLVNPMGFLSRVAPGQLMEISLGKVAKATGKQMRLPQLPPKEGWYNWTVAQMKANNVPETSDMFDPDTGKTIKGLGDGYMFVSAFHHLAEKKASARGGTDGSFSQDEQPAKGGEEGAKRSCFVATQSIRTLHGEESIGHIVDKRIRELVWTRFDDGSWGYSPVTNWFVRKGKMSEVLSIQINYLPVCDHCSRKRVVYGRKTLSVTKNHEIYTLSGKTCAGCLRPGDFVATYGYVPTNDQLSLLYGSMLGDAAICNIDDDFELYYCDQHSDKQYQYVNWKIRQLGTLVGSRKTSGNKSKCGYKGGSGRTSYYTVARHDITIPIRNAFYRVDGKTVKKTVKNIDLDSLTDVAIAAWFVDDGCVSTRKSGGMSGNIATMGFSEDDVDILAKWLSRRLGVECHRGEYNDIRIPTAGCHAMAGIVARYMKPEDIPPSKKWLIGEVSRRSSEYVGVDTAYRLGTVGAIVAKVGPYSDGKHGPDDDICLYDMTVDRSHKYCASDVLVSNSGLDLWAMLSHNVPEVIKDIQTTRGTRNDDYWRALQLGLPIPEPDEPFIYRKFLNTLKAGGVNVTEKGSIVSIMPQTDKDVEKMAQGRVIDSSEMVDPDFEPMKGGLFDLGKTGGMAGNQWSMIKLPEPVPNPIMEEPVRRVLGLTVKEMEEVLSGRRKIDGKTGGAALKDALSKVDVDRRMKECEENMRTKRGASRDDAVKQYRYLSAMKKQGLSPSDWMISNVPVIPPIFRPVSKMGDVALVSDLNRLYKDVIENVHNFNDLKGDVDDDGLVDERLNIYGSVKAAYGLGQPITPENAAKGVKGAIRQVMGNRPKCYDSETELLTKRGWIPFGDVTFDDIVATVNQKTLKMEWQQPSDVIHSDYNGLMVHTLSKKVDLLVTPNHTHFAQKRVHGMLDGCKDEKGRSEFLGWRKVEAANLLYDGARMHLLTAPAGYDGTGEPDLPGVADKMAFAFICGLYIAEGWDTSYSANVCQTSANPAICDMTRAAFDKCGVPYTENTFKKPHGRTCTCWSFHSKETAEWFRTNFGHLAGGKRISDSVLEWDSKYLRQLLDGYLYGDGEKLHGRKDPETNRTFYSKDRLTCEHARANTTSRELVDDIAELCMKVGLGFRLCSVVSPDNPKWNAQYRFRVDGWNKVVVEGQKYHRWESYSGKVHCVTVPNGLVVVRRNGLTAVSGNSGMFQSKVLSKPVGGVSRGVITPDPNLDMDQIGIPEDMAWKMYKPYVMRQLVQHGYPATAAIKMIADRTDTAKHLLDKVMDGRPVIMDRAPTWHKFNFLAFRPTCVEGKTIQVSPLIVSGFNADFDGDTVNVHVPSSDKAVKQAMEKMLPSKNLTSLTDLSSPRHPPSKEQIFGLYSLTKGFTDKPVKRYPSVEAAKEAFRKGEIGPNDPIEIGRH